MLCDLKSQNPIFTPIDVLMYLAGINCDSVFVKNKANRNKSIQVFRRKFNFDKCLLVYEQKLINVQGDIEV